MKSDAHGEGGFSSIQLVGVTKRFGGTRALREVNLTVRAGTVHALIGENGAGKSTIAKIIGGVLAPDTGELRIDGTPVTFRSPRDARAHGIATIAQELTIVPSLSVAANVFLGTEPRTTGIIRSRRLRAQFEELAGEVGFELPPDVPAGALRPADQQKIEILRALRSGASLIVMDEPTATLPDNEAARLHDVIKSLARSGKATAPASSGRSARRSSARAGSRR